MGYRVDSYPSTKGPLRPGASEGPSLRNNLRMISVILENHHPTIAQTTVILVQRSAPQISLVAGAP